MRYFEEETLSLSQLGKHKCALIDRFHDHLHQNEFRITNEFTDFMPFVMLCKFEPEIGRSPDILFIGDSSSQRELFGPEWADNVLVTRQTPDPELEARSSYAYQSADDYGYALHESEGIVKTLDGPQLANFVRYITTVEVANGAKLFCVAGVLQHLQKQ